MATARNVADPSDADRRRTEVTSTARVDSITELGLSHNLETDNAYEDGNPAIDSTIQSTGAKNEVNNKLLPPTLGTTSNHTPSTETASSATTDERRNALEDERAKFKAQKMKSLQEEIAMLQSQVAEVREKISSTRAQIRSDKEPSDIVTAHIRALHDYNAIRDVGLGLLGMIADSRGVRAIEVHREFGIEEGD